ncbi:hypothetical protein [Alteribacter natronophilus]|uniref:hypothetical protein n=1 Tax=Alteribacter natronophilus TaxID=2583810 RepID=UPI001485E25B|nr:hypothetical protein [Alteribacter natronophilus]
MLLVIDWGDVVYQLITLVVLIGIPALIVYFIVSSRRNRKSIEEINRKLDHLESRK